MAADERTAEEQASEQKLEYRSVVARAIAVLRSQEIRDSYASISIEELVDQRIASLEKSTDPFTPSILDKIKKVRDDLVNNIEALKATPPEQFRTRNPTDDANTDPDGEDA